MYIRSVSRFWCLFYFKLSAGIASTANIQRVWATYQLLRVILPRDQTANAGMFRGSNQKTNQRNYMKALSKIIKPMTSYELSTQASHKSIMRVVGARARLIFTYHALYILQSATSQPVILHNALHYFALSWLMHVTYAFLITTTWEGMLMAFILNN